MKKVIAVVLVLLMIVSFTGCTEAEANENKQGKTAVLSAQNVRALSTVRAENEEFGKEEIKIQDLSGYRVVYPSDYDERQKQEPMLLAEVLSAVTGNSIGCVPDTENETNKEIILASSSRKTALSDYVSGLDSRLDYVISVNDGKIILGGQDYYGDMRAVYTFINDYLGYNDVDGVYSQAKDKISGTETYVYEEPDFAMVCGNFYQNKFVKLSQIRDVSECNFNMMLIAKTSDYTLEQFRDLCIWCARFDLRLMLPILLDEETWEFELYLPEAYEDNPIVWGSYIRDEPWGEMYQNLADVIDEYHERYGERGWKTVINFCAGVEGYLNETTGVFTNSDVISFDIYMADGRRENFVDPSDGVLWPYTYEVLSRYRDITYDLKRENVPCFSYIMAYYLYHFNAGKMLRWSEYINLAMGVKGIMYFNYQVWIVDDNLEKTEYWDYARLANGSALEVGEKLADEYEYLGPYTYNVKDNDLLCVFENQYEGFDTIEDFIQQKEKKDPYLVGCYDKKDGDGSAFVIVNLSALDDVPYEETVSESVRIKVKGDKVTFYRDGNVIQAEKDADGYYSVEIGNGQAVFAEVE